MAEPIKISLTMAVTVALSSGSMALAQINPGMLQAAKAAQDAQIQQQQQQQQQQQPAAPPPPPAAAPAAPAAAPPAATPAATTSGAGQPGADAQPADASKSGDDAKDDDEKKAEEEAKDAAAKAEREKLLKQGYDPKKMAVFDFNNGKPLDGIALLKPLLDKNPNDPHLHYLMAIGYVRARQFNQAISQYRTVLKLAPATSKLGQLASEGLKKIAH